MLDVDEEAAGVEVLVVEQVVGRVDRADGEPSGLALVVGLVGGLQQEEDLDDVLDVGEVLLPVRRIVVLRLSRSTARSLLLIHSTSDCHGFWSATKITK